MIKITMMKTRFFRNSLPTLALLTLGIAGPMFSHSSLAQNASSHSAQRPVGCCLSGGGASSIFELGTPLPGNINTKWEAALLEDAEELTRLFSVRPHLFYFRERSSMNAFSIWQNYPNLLAAEGTNTTAYPDGTIFLGLNLIEEEQRNTNGSLFSLPAILAHEYAHTMQAKNRFAAQGKLRELHADFMAGYFIGHRERKAPQNALEAAETLFEKGDTDFNNPQHHGTKEERFAAFLAGYKFNKRSTAPNGIAAYNAGITYLRSKESNQ